MAYMVLPNLVFIYPIRLISYYSIVSPPSLLNFLPNNQPPSHNSSLNQSFQNICTAYPFFTWDSLLCLPCTAGPFPCFSSELHFRDSLPIQGFSTCSPQNIIISINWELVRYVDSQPQFEPTDQKTQGRARILMFTSPPGDSVIC